VEDGLTTHHDFVMRVDPAQVIRRYEQWFHCDVPTAQVRCVPGRHVLSDRTRFRDTTAWVFADSLAFAAFLLQHPSSRLSPPPDVPRIDWAHEAVVAVSYGARTGCHPSTYVNRVEYRARATIVWLGPDSTFIGPQGITCQASWDRADIVIIPAPHQAVVFRTIAPDAPRPPAVIHRSRRRVPNDR
jgi:hypothetical protein